MAEAYIVAGLRTASGRHGLQTSCEGSGTANVTLVERP